MKSVYCLNPISNAGMSRFDDTYCIADSIENADAVLLRSASMHEMTIRMTQILQRQLRRQRRLLLEMKLRERSLA